MADKGRILRWALIGCGEIADRRVAPAISAHPGSELSLVMCRDSDRAGYFAQKHRAVWSTTRPETLFTDPDIDAVYIATPPGSHCELTLAAAAEGKHVLCEKPMALTSDECRRMIEACRAARVTLGVAYYRRCYPQVQAIRSLLESGKLGKPLVVRASVASPFEGRAGDWRLDPSESGGGPLPDIGSHRLDLLAYLFGAPERVGAALTPSSAGWPVEEAATVLLRLPGGVRGVVEAAWNASAPRDLFQIDASQGAVRCDPLNGDAYLVSRQGREERHKVDFPNNVHAPLVADFVEAILFEREPICPGEAGTIATRVIEAAYQSAAERRFIPL
ncbi:Gfo/Idh/MocA family oxidoreductase [bacterium]|nr:Gfo/Idh/MocA family oxidoreductase [bacterium]